MMTQNELDRLVEMGCEIDNNPIFLADEGYFDCLYTISYKGCFVGSDNVDFDFVLKNMKDIDGILTRYN